MMCYRLPVCGIEIGFREPGGHEDLMLAEAQAPDMGLAIALLESVSSPLGEYPLNWATLPFTDIDWALLRLRQNVFGDVICTDLFCPIPTCGKRIDVKFSIDEFLRHHAPREVRGVEPAGKDHPGWFRFKDSEAIFRLPTGADIMTVELLAEPERELIRRCIKPDGLWGKALRRVLRTMEEMVPSLSSELAAQCPECGSSVSLLFDARSFTLRELQGQAAFIYADTHLLAYYYHWPESEILSLPRKRRIHYVEMLNQHQRTL